MFNFAHVLNVTTKERYDIVRAKLSNDDEGYDDSPIGGNLFEIDLEPSDSGPIEMESIYGVELYVSNDGRDIEISKNLDSSIGKEDEEGIFHVELMDAIPEGKTLVVTNVAEK